PSAGGALQTAMRPVMRGVQEVATFRRQIEQLVLDASSLVRDPLSLATRIGDLFRQLITFPTTPRLGVAGLASAYTFTSSEPRPVATTLTREYEQANYDALDRHLRSQIAIAAAQLAAQAGASATRSEEHTSELQSRENLVCR